VVEEAADIVSMLHKREAVKASCQPFDLLILDHGLLDPLPPVVLEQQGEDREKILLLLPTHVSLGAFSSVAWLQSARSARKPVFKFRLLKAISHILGHELCDEEHPVGSPIVARRGPPLNLLLVEDNINNQKLAVAILTQVGHTVTIANNGLEALTRLRGQSYDLVLMDLQMPEMCGMEATRQIRKTDPPVVVNPLVPIIAVTAKATGNEERQCLDVGMDGYLRKPYRAYDLLNIIDRIIRYRQQAVRQEIHNKGSAVLRDVELNSVLFAEKSAVFIKNYPQYLERLGASIANENFVQIGKWADLMSDAARELGAWRVAMQGLRLRSSAEQKDWEATRSALEKLEIFCQEAMQALLEKESCA
jgi:CheY-like chemotaxis protein